MRFGRAALRTVLVVAALAAADRLLAGLVLGDGVLLGRPVAPFDPPLFSPSQREALARIEAELAAPSAARGKFDADLGWCNAPDSGFGEFRYDWAGARIGVASLAREKAAGVRRAVAVGCSMTHGEEVAAGESWSARADAALESLEVANLAVAAYGIDQALLRLRRDGWALAPDEVWLGVLPQAALRTTTLFRPLLDHWSLDIAFKPRFVLAGGELELVPNPARSLADVVGLLRDQRRFLDALGGRDPWVARAPLAYAPRGSSWLHGSFCGRLLLTVSERSGRELASCFDDESEFGRLYTAIVTTMASECEEHGARLRVVVLPGLDDLEQRRRDGRGYWEDWADRLRAAGIRVLDVSPALERDGDPARLFAPAAHYTAEGNERVARALQDELAQ